MFKLMKMANSKKIFTLLGNSAYIFLLILAGFFYLERIVYTDASYYVFKMIHFNSFNIEFSRYASTIYEFLPYIAIKIGMSLNTIVFLFSISVVLVSYGAYILCIHYFNNYTGGFAILLLNFVGVSCTFFYPISELNIGLIFCVIFFVWLEKRINFHFDFLTILIGVIIIAVCILSHPGIIPVLFFLIGYFMVSNRKWKGYNLYIIIFLFIVLIIWKSVQINSNDYESNVLSQLKNYKLLFQNMKHIYSINYYFYRSFNTYIINHFLFLSTAIILLIRRKYFDLLYFSVAFAGILLFYFTLYYAGESNVMMEKAFSPVTVFLIVPFLKEAIFANESKQIIKIAVLTIIIVISISRIFKESYFYIDRVNYLDLLVQQVNTPKTILFFDQTSREKLSISWAIGVETLMYSSIKYPQNVRTVFFIEKGEKLDSLSLSDPNLFLCVSFWPYWKTNELNQKYFKLPQVTYKIMEKD